MTRRRTLLPMLTWTCFALALLGIIAVLPAPGDEPAATAAGSESDGPIVIAHRGSSGYVPELTLPAFTLAHAQDVELIETDVVLTKDNRLINLHDLTLNRTTNVEEVFPDRARADGKHWVADFTLAEIRQLSIDGPTDRFNGSIPSGLTIPTFEELIELVQHLNRTTGRDVGLLVEVKDPAFHLREKLPIERPVLETLARYGYDRPGQGVVVQSFGGDYLRHLRHEHETKLPLVYLFGDKPETLDLDEIATWATGIAPSRGRLEKEGKDLVQQAHDRGMSVYCWTFNDDPALVKKFVDYDIDGIITDYPDVAQRVRDDASQKH